MPLRFLIYIARIYEKLVGEESMYQRKLIPIPKPEFIVLYNGTDNYPEEKILRLSDAFMECGLDSIHLELTVKVLNINYEKSSDILERSKILKDYSYFVALVKGYRKQEISLEEAVERAIRECIKENILKDFLKSNGSEVVNMLFTEFNLEDALAVSKREGIEEGIQKTIAILKAVGVDNSLILTKIKEEFDLTEEELQKYLKR